jgi:steroid 5-alpha reductase family enzyme
LIEALTIGLLVSFLLMTITWGVSTRVNDVSIVDRVWGLNFSFLGLSYLVSAENFSARFLLTIALVTIWGLRLSWHIHTRNRHQGEDYRYKKMRAQRGSDFWFVSLWRVFWLQGLIAVVVSLPLAWIATAAPSTFPSFFDFCGAFLWLVGFAFEAGGDYQLKKFKANPENRGKILDTGFWSMTRHPNYFGDSLIWWGIFIIAFGLEGGWWTIFAPIIMTILLRAVSGVTLLEAELKKTKPGYGNYVARVPAFVPHLGLGNLLRFSILGSLKIFSQIFFRLEAHNVGNMPKTVWSDVRIAVLLNHTSLMEPIFAGVLPFRYLWRLAAHGIFPVADVTFKRPIVGRIFRFFAPKVIMLSRRRDKTWNHFLASIDHQDTMVFLPEGRMKRPNGLDKDGRPMTVRGGVVDIMLAAKSGTLVFCYSEGLHHIFAPGDHFPKLFRRAGIKFEAVDLADYLKQFESEADCRPFVIADLEKRRDRHCPPIGTNEIFQG